MRNYYTGFVIYSNVLKYFRVKKNKIDNADKIDFNFYFDWLQVYPSIYKLTIEYNKNIPGAVLVFTSAKILLRINGNTGNDSHGSRMH
jgi:hypothetical protein